MDTNYTQFQIDTPTQNSFGMQYQSPNQSFDMNSHISPMAMNNGTPMTMNSSTPMAMNNSNGIQNY